MQKSKIFFSIILLAFLLEVFIFSPEFDQKLLIDTVINAFTLNIKELDLSIICVFNSMGIIPLLLGCYLIPQTEKFKPSVLPFWFLSFAFGAGAILPYLILRKSLSDQSEKYLPDSLRSLLKSNLARSALMFMIVSLIGTGFYFGNYENYISVFNNSKLVHVMTVDLLILILFVLPYLIFTESSN